MHATVPLAHNCSLFTRLPLNLVHRANHTVGRLPFCSAIDRSIVPCDIPRLTSQIVTTCNNNCPTTSDHIRLKHTCAVTTEFEIRQPGRKQAKEFLQLRRTAEQDVRQLQYTGEGR